MPSSDQPDLLRPGVDPLVDPRDVAHLARALMSPRDRMLVFLVDHRLVGHVCVAAELERGVEALARVLAAITEATHDTTLTGLVIAERTDDSLHLYPPLVAAILDAHQRGPRVEAWVRFDPLSVQDVWPLVGPDVTTLVGPDVTTLVGPDVTTP